MMIHERVVEVRRLLVNRHQPHASAGDQGAGPDLDPHGLDPPFGRDLDPSGCSHHGADQIVVEDKAFKGGPHE